MLSERGGESAGVEGHRVSAGLLELHLHYRESFFFLKKKIKKRRARGGEGQPDPTSAMGPGSSA